MDFGADGWYERKLEERPLDVDAVGGPDDWSYRAVTWEYGLFWAPVATALRGGKYNHSRLPALAPVGVVDRTHTIGQDESVRHWQDWKTKDLDIFGGQQ
ncbi:hypothetical protein ABZS86_03795 [Streptomyces sp. NPDC005355]|uniref:hypothetical protein n=1 Tax=Streptomyces sp. NPDC005355 TaxID=3157038 RepID=UPI00339FF30E